MFRSVAWWAAPALVTAGCSCNQDYAFPEPLAIQFAEPPPDFGSYLSFGTAPDGRRITMAYYDRVTTGLGFATGTPQSDGTIAWLHERVDGYPEDDGLDRGDRGRYASHVVAEDGTVWIAYQDSDNGTLKVARRLGPNQWESEMVDPGVGLVASGAGHWTSIGLLHGQPIVAHYDAEGEVLRISRRGDSGWSSETAYDGGDVGRYADLLVHDGTVYVAFYNATNGNLELIEGTPGSWSHSEIDTPGDVGQWPDLLADGEDLWVAYHHVGDQDLRLARRTGGSWSIDVIDAGPYRGADTALFLHEGRPQIVYFDGENANMMFASQRDDGSWELRVLGGNTAAVGFYNEVALVGGRIYAGSYDHTHRTLYTTEIVIPTR